MDELDKIKPKKKKPKLTITGVDIDKNEYLEIILSNSNRPEGSFSSKSS